MKINKKKIWWGVLLATIIVAFFVYRYVDDRRIFAKLDQGGVVDYPVSARQYEAYIKDLDARYKNDRYGSTTPEGTLSLFVEALKNEDVDLAAKYFVSEKQVKMVEDLKAGVKSGGVKSLIGDLSKKKIKSILSDYRVRFETVDSNNNLEFSFDLRLNKFTDKWKIESL